MNQEPGNEESGIIDLSEEARKAGLLEAAACGLRSGGGDLQRGCVRVETFLLCSCFNNWPLHIRYCAGLFFFLNNSEMECCLYIIL